MSHPQSTHAPGIPLVVQIGFAGSRVLFDPAAHPGLDAAKFEREIEDHLTAVLETLPETLGLSKKHFLCGISQIAIGADTLFTRACARLGISQRIFLSQHRDAYLAAKGESGTSDFTEAQAAVALKLLQSPHIIEDRVVSDSPERDQRFEDVNLEVVRVSDVVIALRREDAPGKRGGTKDLIERARTRKRAVLEIMVSVQDGHAHFRDEWHPFHPKQKQSGDAHFTPPGVPDVLQRFQHEGETGFVAKLKTFAAGKAGRHQAFFKFAALIIIGTHVAATVLAVSGILFHYFEHSHGLLLGCELALLLGGLFTHVLLHRTEAVEYWATGRLVSEIARSVNALAGVRGYLHHLFLLPLPEGFRPMLRTLNVFHLKATRGLPDEHWQARRAAYVRDRLDDPLRGQISYYEKARASARLWLRVSRCVFYTGSCFAILGTLVKLLTEPGGALAGGMQAFAEPLRPWLSFVAIVLPVLAVAALSFAASLDLEARDHTYGEVLEALKQQRAHLLGATSAREFNTLALRTEARLVGENTNWFSRRVFTGVN